MGVNHSLYSTTNVILTDIISTVTGREHGSFRWKVQYLCKNVTDLKIRNKFKDDIISIPIGMRIVEFTSLMRLLLPFSQCIFDILWKL